MVQGGGPRNKSEGSGDSDSKTEAKAAQAKAGRSPPIEGDLHGTLVPGRKWASHGPKAKAREVEAVQEEKAWIAPAVSIGARISQECTLAGTG